jgi:hypothetical protein
VKRNRFVQLSGGTRKINRELEDKARALAGLKGYVTTLRTCPDGTPVTPEFVIGAYHQLYSPGAYLRQTRHPLPPGTAGPHHAAPPAGRLTGKDYGTFPTLIGASPAHTRFVRRPGLLRTYPSQEAGENVTR